MAFSLSELPAGPHLIAPYKAVQSGVDFLNLRQVNFDFMGDCMPGTNNVTFYVRPYSVLCWIYWTVQQQIESGQIKRITVDELKLFREKVESLQLWGHRIHDIRGLPGMSTDMPESVDGVRSLTFADWGGRKAANTSLQAAVQYGPSVLDIGGLGFLHKNEEGQYCVTSQGAALASALDEQLRKAPDAYEMLTDVKRLSAHESEVLALFEHWRLDQASPKECEVFQAALWNRETMDQESGMGKRSATIQLILEMLNASDDPLSEQVIRERMAFPRLWGRTPESLGKGSYRQSRIWVLLQFRQLHRLALEALMGWMQCRLNDAVPMSDPDNIVDCAHQALIDSLGIDQSASTVEAVRAAGPLFDSLDNYLEARSKEPERFDLKALSDNLIEHSSQNAPELCPKALQALILLYNCRSWMDADEVIQSRLDHGSTARVSLGYCFTTMDRLEAQPAREFVAWVIKSLIICQHFATGTNRFDGERIRLRFILDEDGIESLGGHVWHPNVTPDRLATLLSLMASCGLVQSSEEGFCI